MRTTLVAACRRPGPRPGRTYVALALAGLVSASVIGCSGGNSQGTGGSSGGPGSGGASGGQPGSGGATNTGGSGTGGTAHGGASGGGGSTATGGGPGTGGSTGGASGGGGSTGTGGGPGTGGSSGSGGMAGSSGSGGTGTGGAGGAGAPGARLVQNFNQSWKFKRADVSGAEVATFDDSSWDSVGVPHSFSLPYFMASKFYVGYGWYRKHFTAPSSWAGKSVTLEFQAAFDQAEIYLNGKKVGTAPGRLQRLLHRHHLRPPDRRQRRRRSPQQQVERPAPAAHGRSHLPGRDLPGRVPGRRGSAARRLVRHLGDDADPGDERRRIQHGGDQDRGAERPRGGRRGHTEDRHRRQGRQGRRHRLESATDRGRDDGDLRPDHAGHQRPRPLAPGPSDPVSGPVSPFRRHRHRGRSHHHVRLPLVQLVGLARVLIERRALLDSRSEPPSGSRGLGQRRDRRGSLSRREDGQGRGDELHPGLALSEGAGLRERLRRAGDPVVVGEQLLGRLRRFGRMALQRRLSEHGRRLRRVRRQRPGQPHGHDPHPSQSPQHHRLEHGQ